MISSFFAADNELCCQDIILLETVFIKEVASLLPVPGTVKFWHSGSSFQRDGKKNRWSREQDDQFSSLGTTHSIKHLDDVLFIPLQLRIDNLAGTVITDIDPLIFEKMSSGFLQELQTKIQQRLQQIRSIYIEPISGQYNSRCLLDYLQSTTVWQNFDFLFLVNTSFKRGSAVAGLQKMIQTADLLKAISGAPVFNFGSGLFGLVTEFESGEEAFDFSRKLIKRLKREGALKVHLGLTPLPGIEEKDNLAGPFELCWKSLVNAENRGPYSMCSSQALDPQNAALLQENDSFTMAALSKVWKGVTNFGIILFRIDDPGSDQFDLEPLLRPLLLKGLSYIRVSSAEGYLLIPGAATFKIRSDVDTIYNRMQQDETLQKVSLGVCSWPCLKYSKALTVTNCRKALMHGSFLGTGTCTFFDHISLNVSGDYFFDEGDYRQAVKDYQVGLSLQPDDINLMNSLGVALTEMNRLKPATNCFLKVLQQEEHNLMALVNLGFAKRMLGQDIEALDYFEKAYGVAVESNADVSPDVLMQLGKLYCQEGRFEEAVKVLERWKAKNSSSQEFYLFRLLGEAYMECGRQDDGMQALQKALKLYPRNAESMSLLGLLYFEAGQGDDIGLRLCQKGVATDELNGENWYRLGRVLFKHNEIQKALEAVRTSIRLKKKDNLAARLLLGKIYQHNKQYHLARKVYNGLLKVAKQKDTLAKEVKESLAEINKYYLTRRRSASK